MTYLQISFLEIKTNIFHIVVFTGLLRTFYTIKKRLHVKTSIVKSVIYAQFIYIFLSYKRAGVSVNFV